MEKLKANKKRKSNDKTAKKTGLIEVFIQISSEN